MSILTLPRVSFFGKTEWNPDTTNNYSTNYDAATAEPVPANAERPQYLDNLKQQVASTGNWNLYGDHATTFVDTKINSIQLAGGAVKRDPLLKRPVQLLGLLWSDGANPPGRLVDVDPYGATSSQIFFDSFQIGDDQVGVVGKRVDRFSDRDFYFRRNLNLDGKAMIAGRMGVVWQTAFPKAQLTWTGLDKSKALTALKAAVDAESAAGLVVRFVSYRTQYFTNCEFNGKKIKSFNQLQKAYEQGFQGRNPAYSALLGNVGVWQSGALATGPTSRVLVPVGRVPVQSDAPVAAARAAVPTAELGSKTLIQQQAKLRQPQAAATAAPAAAASPPTLAALGPTQCLVETGSDPDSGTVVFDFMNAVPEINQKLVKADLGSFQVQVRDLTDNTKVTPLGAPIDYAAYDRNKYQASGGVLSVPFACGGSALQNGKLEVISVSNPQAPPLLVERRWEVVTDAKSIYLDEGQTVTVQLTVQDRGEPATGADLVVSIGQYLGSYDTGDLLVKNPFKLTDASGNLLPLDGNNVATIPVQNSVASFQVSPAKAGTGALCYIAHLKNQPVAFPDALDVSESFSNIRNLPWDQDLAQYDKPGVTIPWTVVYESILRVYDLVYPVMSLVIDLHNKQAVDGAVVQFRAATAKDIFESGLFMPITRELSERKRNILWRYLQQVEMGGGSSPS